MVSMWQSYRGRGLFHKKGWGEDFYLGVFVGTRGKKRGAAAGGGKLAHIGNVDGVAGF